MLVLQRKKDESIVIDNNISITVSDIGSDWVRLAIDAPKSIRIIRKELLEAAASNKEAADNRDAESISKLRDLLQ